MTTVLTFHPYTYYPYEKTLAELEARRLLSPTTLRNIGTTIEVEGIRPSRAAHLTYFAQVKRGETQVSTLQAQLESVASAGRRRQSTRYSVHGLHEYKGKFNPQIAKALLNICGITSGKSVLDPFCGSGTTLVEACHLGATVRGYDVNPFAIFIANAKLLALKTPADELRRDTQGVWSGLRSKPKVTKDNSARAEYLRKWFDSDVFIEIERLDALLERTGGPSSVIVRAIASDLLRDYSRQEPADLRIRRRKSPMPKVAFLEALRTRFDAVVETLGHAQAVLGDKLGRGAAHFRDTTKKAERAPLFDAAVTSPPYAMALPYIDTQRLSLVWLRLSEPQRISSLEGDLVGNREIGANVRRLLEGELMTDKQSLPAVTRQLCREALESLTASDGFRRRAVPALLYRYFSSMQSSFESVFQELKSGAPYALVVGHNHTTLGGRRVEINTPVHLAAIAESVGWHLQDILPLQTYHRWGLHAANAVAAESLILLRRP